MAPSDNAPLQIARLLLRHVRPSEFYGAPFSTCVSKTTDMALQRRRKTMTGRICDSPSCKRGEPGFVVRLLRVGFDDEDRFGAMGQHLKNGQILPSSFTAAKLDRLSLNLTDRCPLCIAKLLNPG